MYNPKTLFFPLTSLLKKEAIVIFLHDLIKARFFDFLLRDKRFDGYFDITHRPLQRFITPFRIQKMKKGLLIRIPYRAEEAIQVTQYIKAIKAIEALLQSIEDIQDIFQFIECTQAIEEATRATEGATQAIQLIIQFIDIQATKGATQATKKAAQDILQFIEDIRAAKEKTGAIIKSIEAAEEAIPFIKTILRFIKRTQATQAIKAINTTQATQAAKNILQSIEATKAAKEETQAIQPILQFINDTQPILQFINDTQPILQFIEDTQTIHIVQLTSLGLVSSITLFIPFLDLVSIMRLMSVCKCLHIFNIMNKAYKIIGSLFDAQLHLRLGDLFTSIQDSTPREYIKQLVLGIIRCDPKAISIRDFKENQTWLPYLFVDEKYSVLLSSRLTVCSSIVGLLDQYQSFATLLIFQDTTFELALRETSFTVVNFSSLVYLFLERCKIGYFGHLELKSDTLKMIQLLYNEFSLSEGWPSKIICPKNLKRLVVEHDGKSSFCIEVYKDTKVE
jgi:hypothetical protein